MAVGDQRRPSDRRNNYASVPTACPETPTPGDE